MPPGVQQAEEHHLSASLSSLKMAAGAAEEDGGVVGEVYGRHGHSAQPESQQVLAVMQAVLDVIRAEAMPVTPTTMFAAVMSALEKPEAQAAPQMSLAMCTLLGYVLPRVPDAVLRSKFVGATGVLSCALDAQRSSAPAAKACLLCLGQLLAAAEPGAWPAAARAWALLLGFTADLRPKVRRRAVSSAADVLGALQQRGPAFVGASEAVTRLASEVLPGPAAAARAAAAASNKQRAGAEAAIAAAVADALHVLGALKALLPLMAAPALPRAVDAIVKLLPLRQPLLSRHATDALAALAAAPSSRLPAPALRALLRALLDDDVLWSTSGGRSRLEPEGTVALVRLVEAAMFRLLGATTRVSGGGIGASADVPAEAADAALLARSFHALVPLLAAEAEGVRYAAGETLRALAAGCVSQADVAAAVAAAARGAGNKPPPLASVVAAACAALGARYADAWGHALPVAGALLTALGAAGAPLAEPLLRQLGELCGGAFDAGEADDDAAAAAAMEEDGDTKDDEDGGRAAAARHAGAAEVALGAALRALGPEAVLRVLPLQLEAGLSGTGEEARTWLLPLLRRYVRGAPLAYWSRELHPLARALGARAAAAQAAGQPRLALSCHALELQLWATLPAFVDHAPDVAEAYPRAAREMAGAFSAREDLRPSVAAALVRLSAQAVGTLVAARDARAPPAAVAAAAAAGNSAATWLALAGRSGGAVGAPPPAAWTPDVAAASLNAQRALSRSWLPLLATTMLASPPEARGPMATAAGALALSADSAALADFFRSLLRKLAAAIAETGGGGGGESGEGADAAGAPTAVPSIEQAAALLELAAALVPGLPDAALVPLLAAARPAVLSPAALLQKRGYRLLAALCASRASWLDANLAPTLELLLAGSAVATSAAKRFRLRCLRPLIAAVRRAGPEHCPALSGLVDADTGAELVPGGAALAAAPPGGRARALLALLVAELVLCTKEANEKTRGAAYQLLVDIAHDADEAAEEGDDGGEGGGVSDDDVGADADEDGDAAADSDDEAIAGARGGAGGGSDDDDSDDDDDDYGMQRRHRRRRRAAADDASVSRGEGLHDFVSLVLAGLAGASPHMVSATVMSLARLLYEFGGALAGVAERLLPATLALMRSPNREVVKSVLGLLKVAAMRLPVDEVLTPALPRMLEAMLVWADDSKNRFRLKVRVIVERLARRCGHAALAAACPPGEERLISHVRKQHARKERRRADGRSDAGGGSQAGDDARSHRSGGTARASEWAHSRVFSDDDEQEATRTVADGRGAGAGARSHAGRSARTAAGGRGGGAGGRLADGGDDPQDLLHASTARALLRTAAGQGGGGGGGAGGNTNNAARRSTAGGDADYSRADDGRLVINDDDAAERARARKRRRGGASEAFLGDGGGSDDDSDYDDMRHIPGAVAAMRAGGGAAAARSVRFAPSVAGGRSEGGRSRGGGVARSVGGRSGASGGGRSVGGRSVGANSGGRGAAHSGDRFKARRADTGGDVKGKSKVEPYAYWKFDRRMLNPRRGKQAAAKGELGGLVRAAQAGAAKGAKAKRAAAGGGGVKRQRGGGDE